MRAPKRVGSAGPHGRGSSISAEVRGSACWESATSAKGASWDHVSDNRPASDVTRPMACPVNQMRETGKASPVGWLMAWVDDGWLSLLASAGRVQETTPSVDQRLTLLSEPALVTEPSIRRKPGLWRSRPPWRLLRVVKEQRRLESMYWLGRVRRDQLQQEPDNCNAHRKREVSHVCT
jgi:hypothetical protein